MKKALFLDIDGVLNSDTSEYDWIAPELADRLTRIVNTCNPDIVISSSWRSMGLKWLKEKWQECGLPSSPLDVVPEVSISEAIAMMPGSNNIIINKGIMIKKWLKQHPDYTHYAIVDDWPIALPDQECRFVRTDSSKGLTDDDVESIISLFI